MKTAILVDDHGFFRSILRNQLKDFRVVGEASDGDAALELVKNEKPDLVILDLSMPKDSGLKLIPRIKSLNSASKILVLTIHSSADLCRKALEAGASGYCLKDAASGELRSAISIVMQGGTYISPSLKVE